MGVFDTTESRIVEHDYHFHSIERWYGDDGDDTMSVANNLVTWTLTAGNSTVYGTEVQLSGGSDVLDADYGIAVVEFDTRRLLVTDSNQFGSVYMIQLWAGLTTFGAATVIAEIPRGGLDERGLETLRLLEQRLMSRFPNRRVAHI